MKNCFEFELKVTKNDLDHLNHVNNMVYVHWVLNAAQNHWNILSTSKMNERYVWVVLRHEIDYFSSAKLNDKICIKTWVENAVGVKSQRIVEINKGGENIAKALTTWCLLDKNTMKPVRIPPEIIEVFS